MRKKWYTMNEQELEQELSTSAVNGLSKKAVAARRRQGGSNIVFRLPHGSFSSYFKDIMSDSSSIILIVAALIASLFQNTAQAYVIAGIITLNCAVAVLTYVKSHRVLESMDEYSLPGAKVVRDGHLYLVPMSSLVVGDLIYLKAGDIVPADARIITADGFYVSENGITGNTSAVRKSPQNISPDNNSDESMFNMVFASSVVLKGSARAIVVETGEDTLAVRTNSSTLTVDHDSLDIFVMLKRYGSKISLLMLAMVVVIMFLEIVTGLNNRGIYEIFLSGMSLAVAAMTEFYIAFGYIVVACGLFPSSMGKNRRQGGVILKNISKLEKLRDIDCVIFKKDGVLTELSKQVEAMYANGSLYRTGDYDRANESFAPLVEAAVITTGQYMKSSLAHQGTGSERTAECEAIIDCAKRYSLYNVGLDSRYPLLYHKTSMQSPSYSMSIVDDGKKRYAYIRGSARDMLEHCISLKVAGTHLPINKEVKLDIASVIAEYEKVNAGVYAIAVCEIGRELPNEPYALLRKNELELIGLLMIRARLYDGCALTIERLKSCGIKLVLSASDSAEDIAIAKTLGICTDERDILTERVLSSMTDDSLTETAHAYSLYSGLKNASLRRVMNALKQRGMRVAYSARSLSEISLLDTADIGFSQTELPEKKSSNTKLTREREAGDDALRFRSDVLISQNESGAKSGIDAIERSILTAKLIYKNVMNMFAYLAEVQFARLFIVLYSVFTRSTMLEPMQILVGGLIFDLLAVLAITFSRPSKRTYKEYEQAANELADLPHFILRNALFGVFWAAMTIFVPMILSSFGLVMTDTMLSSTVFITFTILQPLVLAEAKRSDSIIDISSVSYNPVYVMMCICAATIIAVGILVPKFGAVIGVTLPSVASLISMLVTVACVLMLHEAYKLIAKNAK